MTHTPAAQLNNIENKSLELYFENIGERKITANLRCSVLLQERTEKISSDSLCDSNNVNGI